jgi:biopolymer transport protein ExbD
VTVQFRRPTPSQVGIDIAPLVDVVFLLVIFFAVSTTFLETSGLEIELPSSSSTADREPRELSVVLDADGTLSFGGEVVERGELGGRLREALQDSERKLVVLRADREAHHGDVVTLMDVIRDAGAEAMTIAARSPAAAP